MQQSLGVFEVGFLLGYALSQVIDRLYVAILETFEFLHPLLQSVDLFEHPLFLLAVFFKQRNLDSNLPFDG